MERNILLQEYVPKGGEATKGEPTTTIKIPAAQVTTIMAHKKVRALNVLSGRFLCVLDVSRSF